jgi:hypothetical protein
MNLTGIRLAELRAGDLKPSNLKQTFYSANARVVRYYEGLRVVYELESRVHDLQTDSDTKPATSTPSPGAQQPFESPDQTAPEPSKPAAKAPGPGSSRRESLMPSGRLVAVDDSPLSQHHTVHPEIILRTGTIRNDQWIDVRKEKALA